MIDTLLHLASLDPLEVAAPETTKSVLIEPGSYVLIMNSVSVCLDFSDRALQESRVDIRFGP